MADLTNVQSSGSTIIVGSDSSGSETTPVGSTLNGELLTSDIINSAGQFRAQTITNTASEALGAVTILANRKVLSITPTDGTVYWGYSNSVTTITGTPIFKNQNIVFAIGSNIHIYLISASSVNCRIAEGS